MKFHNLGTPLKNYFHERFRHILKSTLPPADDFIEGNYPTNLQLIFHVIPKHLFAFTMAGWESAETQSIFRVI